MSAASSAPLPHDQSWDEYVADFRAAAHQAADWMSDYLANSRKYPVVAQVRPGEMTDSLPVSAPEQGEPYARLMSDFEQLVMPAVTHWNHPGFLAYFATTASAPAIIAEMLATTVNTNGLHWKTSPAIAELEHLSLDWLRQWLGLPPDYFGVIYDTASVSSLHAIAAAREMADPEARTRGLTPGLVLYTSEQSHSSIDKAAIALGIGHENVRKVPADTDFRMRPDTLAAMIESDRTAGKRPFCVVATVGTTSSTSVDPVAAIADIAEHHTLWLHIDAAYAGTAAILPEMQHILAGAERAHSLVVNPHKWMFIPVDLSAFYTRRPDILRRAFSLIPEYLRPEGDPRAINYMDYGIPLGRRFRALKLWFAMKYFGREGIQSVLRTHIAWAQQLAMLIRKDSRFEISAPHPFSVVCFRFKGSDDDNRAILEKVNAAGRFYISHTSLRDQVVLRIAIGNLGTTWQDIADCWESIRSFA